MSARITPSAARLHTRRRLLQSASALALITCVPARAADGGLPAIPELTTFLAGRAPRRERVRLELPRIADNGLSVPLRIAVSGPFAPGPFVRRIALFSEINPVPEMAVFEFPQPLERIEIDARVRLAGTQQVVAVAELTDGTLLAAAMEVVVTLGGCMDGT
jgi:sulfur-oxidizing protein SoxY